MRTLRIAAGVEAASLAVLFINLFTVHERVVTSLCGPLHGTAYLLTIAGACLAPGAAGSGARWRAVIPGIGGLLALARLRGRTPAERHDTTERHGMTEGTDGTEPGRVR